jgi:hypothetical protein
MWETHVIKTTCVSHMSRNTCHSYMWVVGNFLQTSLYEIYVLKIINWSLVRIFFLYISNSILLEGAQGHNPSAQRV